MVKYYPPDTGGLFNEFESEGFKTIPPSIQGEWHSSLPTPTKRGSAGWGGVPRRIPPELCARCKGYKRLCGLPQCPILERFRAQVKALLAISGNDVTGYTPPSGVVGERGYPEVHVYYMLPPNEDPERARYHEAPREWSLRREPLHSIIELRGSMIAATLKVNVGDVDKLLGNELAYALISSKPVSSEAKLAKPPTPRLIFDGISKPVGPTGPAERIRVTGNPWIDRKLERLLWDDVPASQAVVELYRSGVDVYTIQKAFSLGLLGRHSSRRLVPTRWAITAVDDIISGELRMSLRDRPELESVELYRGEYLGNRFHIILYPGNGYFEWIELWYPASIWTRGATKPLAVALTEDPLGRASDVDGGFSAARLAVLEALSRRGRRADAIIVREITPDYYAPVGNWHIRETVRRILEGPPATRFDELQDAVNLLLSKLESPQEAVKASPTLRGLRRRRLTEYWPYLEGRRAGPPKDG